MEGNSGFGAYPPVGRVTKRAMAGLFVEVVLFDKEGVGVAGDAEVVEGVIEGAASGVSPCVVATAAAIREAGFCALVCVVVAGVGDAALLLVAI